jgi:CSLREA domain-containing protein
MNSILGVRIPRTVFRVTRIRSARTASVVVACCVAGIAHGAVFNVANGDVSGLVSAITTANGNNQADTINLATDGNYTLTAVNHSDAQIGPSGLPQLLNDVSGLDITINGNGATIERSAGSADFRILATGDLSSGNAQLVINNLTFLRGSASPAAAGHNSGGGLYNRYAHVTLNQCVFRQNKAFYGAGLHMAAQGDSATTIVNTCTFEDNLAEREGGAIRNSPSFSGSATLTVTDSVFARNVAESGGAIFNNGFEGSAIASISRSTVRNNVASGSGGGIENLGAGDGNGVISVSDSLITDNEAGTGGGVTNGAFFNQGNAGTALFTIFRSALLRNKATSATADFALGGAARNSASNLFEGNPSATLAFYHCTLADNSAYRGGAIFNGTNNSTAATAQLIVRNSTLSENVATEGNGGAIYDIKTANGTTGIQIGSTILHRGSTISSNITTAGGGSFTSQGYNLSDDSAAGLLTGPADQINTDPKLDPLGPRDHGGPTLTIALMQGPAVDRGKNLDGAPVDQRGAGNPRTYDSPFFTNASPGGDGTDVGAYEAIDVLQTGEPQFNVTTLDDHDDGTAGMLDCSLREALNRANAVEGANTVLFLTGGTINLNSALGPLTITGPTTLAGFGARSMTLSGGNSGPVLRVSGGPSSIIGFTIRDGRADDLFGGGVVGGGGLVNSGTLTVNLCTFVNNQAAGRPGMSPGQSGWSAIGGAVANLGTGKLTLNRCTFAANVTRGGNGFFSGPGGPPGGDGGLALGAFYNDTGASLTLNSCTIAGNTATGGAGGQNTGGNGGNGGASAAGVYNKGILLVSACTFANNTAAGGSGGVGNTPAQAGTSGSAIGGVQHVSGTATVRNSIVALNTGSTAPDVSGTFVSSGYNLIGVVDGASGFSGTADQVGSAGAPRNPNLGPLQNNGGATDTHALLTGSPAIDAGQSFGFPIDQRGRVRPNDLPSIGNPPGSNGADIGSFEFGPSYVVTTLDDHDDGVADDFDCTLREAINAANVEPGDQSIQFSSALSGTIQLKSALPNLSTTIFLQGPGADVITVRRNTGGDYRIFKIGNGTNNGPFVSIRGLTIANGKVGAPTVLETGGGIQVDRSVLDLQSCTITGNVANSHGGGIFIVDRANDNSMISNCTFSANNASGGNGGALCVVSATALVSNCTFSANNSVNGGALFSGITFNSQIMPFLVVERCTLSGNTALRGGGLSTAYGEGIPLRNCIFNNVTGGNLHTFSGAPISAGFNLSSDNGAGFLTGPGDLINTNPLLGPLASNGGPTHTHALLAGSPAINAGEMDPTGDQRGYPRIGATDIGAFEFDSFPVRILSIQRLTDGSVRLDGQGVVNSAFSIHASLDLTGFSIIGSVVSNPVGYWTYFDFGSIGEDAMFYKASYP